MGPKCLKRALSMAVAATLILCAVLFFPAASAVACGGVGGGTVPGAFSLQAGGYGGQFQQFQQPLYGQQFGQQQFVQQYAQPLFGQQFAQAAYGAPLVSAVSYPQAIVQQALGYAGLGAPLFFPQRFRQRVVIHHHNH